MPHRYLDHGSEIGVLATGADVPEAFAEAARALFGIQVDRGALVSDRRVRVAGSGADLPEALVDWLNALLAAQDIEDTVFADVADVVVTPGAEWAVAADALGAARESALPHVETEAKAVTYHGLAVIEGDGEVTVRFVVDV